LAHNTLTAYLLNFLLQQQCASHHRYFVLTNEIQTHLNNDVNAFCLPRELSHKFLFQSRQKMTQQELADEAGVTRQTIIAIESGKYAPSLPLAFRIAQTFGVSIEAVFQYENG